MRIQILVYDGFHELDALGPLAVLEAAEGAGAGFQTELVRLASATVTSARGLTLHVQRRLEPEHPPGILLVPGGGSLRGDDHGSWAEMHRERIGAAIAGVYASGTIIAAISTGSLLLAAADLVSGRPAAGHRGCRDDLEAAGARVVRARVVDDGDVLTSGDFTAGLDLAVWVVERFAGAVIAREVEERMEYDRRGTVWRRSP